MKEGNNQKNHCHFYRGYFKEGVGRGGLGEDAAKKSMIVSISLKLSSIFLAYFLQASVFLQVLVDLGR
jgi:hypothetical protein